MRKLLSTHYNEPVFNLALFILRVSLALLMLFNHGVPKLVHFNGWQHSFYNFLNIGHRASLLLSILAEVFGSMLLTLGIFSRLAALLLTLDMAVAVFFYNAGQPIINYEDAVLFLAGFFCILLVGPGKWSVDAMVAK